MSYIKKALKESQNYFSDRADENIKRNRKADFTVKILKNGKPVNTAEITYKLK